MSDLRKEAEVAEDCHQMMDVDPRDILKILDVNERMRTAFQEMPDCKIEFKTKAEMEAWDAWKEKHTPHSY